MKDCGAVLISGAVNNAVHNRDSLVAVMNIPIVILLVTVSTTLRHHWVIIDIAMTSSLYLLPEGMPDTAHMRRYSKTELHIRVLNTCQV